MGPQSTPYGPKQTLECQNGPRNSAARKKLEKKDFPRSPRYRGCQPQARIHVSPIDEWKAVRISDLELSTSSRDDWHSHLNDYAPSRNLTRTQQHYFLEHEYKTFLRFWRHCSPVFGFGGSMRFRTFVTVFLALFSSSFGAADDHRPMELWQTNAHGDDIHIVEIAHHSLRKRLIVGPNPHGIATDQKQTTVFVTLERNGEKNGELLWIDPDSFLPAHRWLERVSSSQCGRPGGHLDRQTFHSPRADPAWLPGLVRTVGTAALPWARHSSRSDGDLVCLRQRRHNPQPRQSCLSRSLSHCARGEGILDHVLTG